MGERVVVACLVANRAPVPSVPVFAWKSPPGPGVAGSSFVWRPDQLVIEIELKLKQFD